jgi:FO synthase
MLPLFNDDLARPSELRALATLPLPDLLTRASALRDVGHGRLLSYSRKVFIPLTKLCRDVCHYCTFAERPRRGHSPYLSPDEVLAIAKAGAEAGCHEAPFTLGDKPELRYTAARVEPVVLTPPRSKAPARA